MKLRKIIILILFILLISMLKMCVVYTPKNYYYMNLNEQPLTEEKIDKIWISNEEIVFFSSNYINESLVLKKVSLTHNNMNLGEAVINKKIFEMFEKDSYSEYKKYIYSYIISDDIMKILGKDYERIRKNEEEYLYGKPFKLVITLENTDTNKLYEIVFDDVNLYYQRKGFDLWVPNI